MSRYTMRIKEIMENYYILDNQQTTVFEQSDITENDSWNNTFKEKYLNYKTPFEQEIPTVDDIINGSWKKLFNFSYPKLPDYKEGQLEKKIIKHYYMREIGFETLERFKLALNETLNRIMPYYTELYNSIKLNEDNPLVNYELRDNSTRETTNQGESTSTSNNVSNANNKQIFEDTPSNKLDIDANYATNITKNEGQSTDNVTNNSNDNSTSNDTYNRNAVGLMGYSKQDMISRYRDNLINIDELIIMELSDLFMLLY